MNNATAIRAYIGLGNEAYFSESAVSYQRAADTYAAALERAMTAGDCINDLKARMRDVEAEAIANGMAEGKNEKEREAALRVYLAKLPAWQKAAAELRQAEMRKTRAENEQHIAANEMSVQRRRMDASIAWVQRETAIKANSGIERTEPR